jgi:predicted nucleotidyltransferase
MLFGSFCSGLWHKGSDLDLTITGRWRNRHGQLLDMVSSSSSQLC